MIKDILKRLLLVTRVRRFVYPLNQKVYLFYSSQYYGKDLKVNNIKQSDLDIDENITIPDVIILHQLVDKIKVEKPVIVEIGSWKGKSTSVIAEANKGAEVFAIDHWQGNAGTWNQEISATNDIFAIFKRNMKILGVWDRIHPLVMSSDTASVLFKDKQVDLIFIDGDHTYNGVSSDIKNWFPKVKKGGIICGHDCNARYEKCTTEIQKVINENIDKDDVAGIGHCGVIKAVYDNFGSDYQTSVNSGIWWHRKS